MSLLRRLLLLPLLAPVLAVLVIGALNPRPPVRLRLLIWTSPPLPIGVWLMLASGGGALLSAGSAALALRESGPSLQRQVVRDVWPESDAPAEPRPRPAPAWQREPKPEPVAAAPTSAGPSRPPGEPAPTVAVAYRVIRRPAGQHAADAGRGGEPGAGSTARDQGVSGHGSSEHDGSEHGGGDGWAPLPGEEW